MGDPAGDDLKAVDLNDAERSFMYFALTHWGGPASYKPSPGPDETAN